jgi:hypothetical protein
MQVEDKSFVVTLTSNEFQKQFPTNTVSRFRAKLPVQLILPQNVNYKVALVKLLYRNTINNLGGRGAKTLMIVSNGATFEEIEVPLPELQLTTLGQVVTVLKYQLKAILPKYVTDFSIDQNAPTIVLSAISTPEIAEYMNATPLATKLQFVIKQSQVRQPRIHKRKAISVDDEESQMQSDDPATQMSQRAARKAEQLQLFIQETKRFFEKINRDLEKLGEILFNPFYTAREKCVEWTAIYMASDPFYGLYGEAQHKSVLWGGRVRTIFPYQTQMTILQKMDKIYHQNFMKFFLRPNSVFEHRFDKEFSTLNEELKESISTLKLGDHFKDLINL